MLLNRYPKGSHALANFHVVHCPTMIPTARCVTNAGTNWDTLAWRTGRLTAGFRRRQRRAPGRVIVVTGPPPMLR